MDSYTALYICLPLVPASIQTYDGTGEEAFNEQLSGDPMWRRMEMEILNSWLPHACLSCRWSFPFLEIICGDVCVVVTILKYVTIDVLLFCIPFAYQWCHWGSTGLLNWLNMYGPWVLITHCLLPVYLPLLPEKNLLKNLWCYVLNINPPATLMLVSHACHVAVLHSHRSFVHIQEANV